MLVQRLLQLSAADVFRFAHNKQDADTFLESIRSLRETGVSTYEHSQTSQVTTSSVQCRHSMLCEHDQVASMQTVVTKLMAEDSANNFSQNSGSEDSSPLPSETSTPTGAEAQAVEGPFHTGEVCEAPQPQADLPYQLANQASQLVEEQPEPHQPTLPIPQPPRVGVV